jgi:hypothetical protein
MTAANQDKAEVIDYDPVERRREPLTPIEIEQELSHLLNAITKNQLMLMRLRTDEMDAKIAYEKRHLVATMSDDCPKVVRGGITVAERDDWIRHQEFDEYTAYEYAKKRVKNCRDYQASLEQACSLVQSMNRSVIASYWGGQPQGPSR